LKLLGSISIGEQPSPYLLENKLLEQTLETPNLQWKTRLAAVKPMTVYTVVPSTALGGFKHLLRLFGNEEKHTRVALHAWADHSSLTATRMVRGFNSNAYSVAQY